MRDTFPFLERQLVLTDEQVGRLGFVYFECLRAYSSTRRNEWTLAEKEYRLIHGLGID